MGARSTAAPAIGQVAHDSGAPLAQLLDTIDRSPGPTSSPLYASLNRSIINAAREYTSGLCDWERQAVIHKQLMLPIMQCLPLVSLEIIL